MVCLPFVGNYKTINTTSNNNEPLDIYEIIALAKRLNITLADMREMSFVSLVNILLSTVEEKNNNACQSDIDRFLG